ncbi:MAG: peptidase MA family metallohydrolase [Chloroflexota bacterium]
MKGARPAPALGVPAHSWYPRSRDWVALVIICALLLSVGAGVAWPGTVAAQVISPSRGISSSALDAQLNFPRDVTFRLSASADVNIVAATLRYKQVGQSTVTTNQVTFAPNSTVDLSYAWDLQKYYVPPGVEIEYYWMLEDASGRRVRTDSRTFVLDDKRYNWHERTDGGLRVFWYSGDDNFGAQLVTAGRGALDQLARDAGVPTGLPVKVFVYASQKDLLGALRPSAQEWTGGEAFTSQGIVVVAVEPTSSGLDFGKRVLPHELTHVVVGRMTENPYGDLPRWLDEGLAMYAEGNLEPAYDRALSTAKRDNSMISVQSLSANFPSDSREAMLSYAESYSLVKYIVGHYGRDRLSTLLAVFKEGSTYDAALQEALGVDGAGLESAWREAIGAQPIAPSPAAAPATGGLRGESGLTLPVLALVSGALTLLVVFGVVAMRMRRRES